MAKSTEPDGYTLESDTYKNIVAVKRRLYAAGDKPLTRDDIRDLANILDANLAKAVPIWLEE